MFDPTGLIHVLANTLLIPDQLVTIFDHVTDERLVQETGCMYQFNISGDEEVWYLDLKNGRGRAGKGPPLGCTPDAVISLSSEDMQALFAGENQMTAFNAYMQGRVTVEGAVRMAMKLQSVVQGPRSVIWSGGTHLRELNTRSI